MHITIAQTGNFKRLERYLQKSSGLDMTKFLSGFGQKGVNLLAQATPKDTGETSNSWFFDVKEENGKTVISWYNGNVSNGGEVIALLIQYGHGTGTGGYIPPIDFVNPAMTELFDTISEELKQEVNRLL